MTELEELVLEIKVALTRKRPRLMWTNCSKRPTYNITVSQIRVGTTLIDSDFTSLFDSGTSFTYLVGPSYTRLSESFNAQTKDKRRPPDPRIPFEYCYDMSFWDIKLIWNLACLDFGTDGGPTSKYLIMASENVEISNEAHETVESPTINTQDNVHQDGNNPQENNNADQMINDEMFRGFMQFMQRQARTTPVQNAGENTGNSRTVTAKQFKELGPPEFIGEPKSLKAETWIKQITKIFDVLGCSEEQKVPFATFMLRGEADYWWQSVKRTQPAALKMSWQELFNDKYFPESIRHMKDVRPQLL